MVAPPYPGGWIADILSVSSEPAENARDPMLSKYGRAALRGGWIADILSAPLSGQDARDPMLSKYGRAALRGGWIMWTSCPSFL